MNKTILLADDSVTIQKVVELTFIEEDVDVVAVGSGEAALERWAELEPDLVIADVHMPGPDGYEVCRTIKRQSAATPVLLLVGTFEPFNPSDVEASGADAFLKKPFDSQELLRHVERLLHEKAGAKDRGPSADAAPAPSPDAAAAATEAPERPAPAPAASAESDARPQPDPEPRSAAKAALSDDDLERVARRVAELLGESAVRDVAWEVVPDLAEVVIRERLRELESQVD